MSPRMGGPEPGPADSTLRSRRSARGWMRTSKLRVLSRAPLVERSYPVC